MLFMVKFVSEQGGIFLKQISFSVFCLGIDSNRPGLEENEINPSHLGGGKDFSPLRVDFGMVELSY